MSYAMVDNSPFFISSELVGLRDGNVPSILIHINIKKTLQKIREGLTVNQENSSITSQYMKLFMYCWNLEFEALH